MYSEEKWKAHFLSVVELFQEIDWGARTRDIYQQMATRLLSTARCDSVCIRLLSAAGDEMIGYVYAGEAKDLAKQQFPTLSVDMGRMSLLFEEFKPILYDFASPEEGDIASEQGIGLGYSHAVSVPLVSAQSLVGAVDFMFKSGSFDTSPDFTVFLTKLCRILGPISAALSTSEEMLELRGGEEAKRIGSELHDNLAQPMSVIVLEADKAMLAHEEQDEDQLRESLKRVQALARHSFDMMSQEVAMLHSASGISEDLSKDVERYVTDFERQWGLPIFLELPKCETLVSKTVANQAMRILHEAMSNVLRHARAQEVAVNMKAGQGAIELSIEDNGCGFDVTERSNQHLGLKIMEERAESVGGRLTIASIIGEGTSVIADLPMLA